MSVVASTSKVEGSNKQLKMLYTKARNQLKAENVQNFHLINDYINQPTFDFDILVDKMSVALQDMSLTSVPIDCDD